MKGKCALLVYLILQFTAFVNAQDAIFNWANSLDGPGQNVGLSVACDSYGNSYVTGRFARPRL